MILIEPMIFTDRVVTKLKKKLSLLLSFGIILRKYLTSTLSSYLSNVINCPHF